MNWGDKMSKYSVLIQYDNIDDIYVASIPELQGCTAHGRTQEEAFREVNIVRDMWIETAKEEGVLIPEPPLFNDIVV